jgi:hypothetical protein
VSRVKPADLSYGGPSTPSFEHFTRHLSDSTDESAAK